MSATLIVVLALRGAAAVGVLTTFVGGVPRVVQAALAVALGLWSALLVAPAAAPLAAGIPWELAARELIIGATLGIGAAVPLLAAAAAGRIVDIAATGRPQGPYAALFGVLAAAVFVGIDGHVAVIDAIVTSHRDIPALVATRLDAMAALGRLVPTAVRLAVPWLVTAAVVQIAAGVGTRLAGRANASVPGAVAVPAALVMMTASLVATLAVATAAVIRHAL
ncbi:MAG: flagellar biosynthetic protein FliR [Kofleriaceae bacterium]